MISEPIMYTIPTSFSGDIFSHTILHCSETSSPVPVCNSSFSIALVTIRSTIVSGVNIMVKPIPSEEEFEVEIVDLVLEIQPGRRRRR